MPTTYSWIKGLGLKSFCYNRPYCMIIISYITLMPFPDITVLHDGCGMCGKEDIHFLNITCFHCGVLYRIVISTMYIVTSSVAEQIRVVGPWSCEVRSEDSNSGRLKVVFSSRTSFEVSAFPTIIFFEMIFFRITKFRKYPTKTLSNNHKKPLDWPIISSP